MLLFSLLGSDSVFEGGKYFGEVKQIDLFFYFAIKPDHFKYLEDIFCYFLLSFFQLFYDQYLVLQRYSSPIIEYGFQFVSCMLLFEILHFYLILHFIKSILLKHQKPIKTLPLNPADNPLIQQSQLAKNPQIPDNNPDPFPDPLPVPILGNKIIELILPKMLDLNNKFLI